MTPEDSVLDKELLLKQSSLLLYRLTRRKLATLSGTGAALFPGRWNKLGESPYTSVGQGTTVLERLVHTPKDEIPSNLAMMQIRITGTWSPYSDSLQDELTGRKLLLLPSLAQARHFFRFIGNLRDVVARPFAVAVPSIPLNRASGNRSLWKELILSSSTLDYFRTRRHLKDNSFAFPKCTATYPDDL